MARYGGVAEYFVQLAMGMSRIPQIRPVYCAGIYCNHNLRANRNLFETRGIWFPRVYRILKMDLLSDALCTRQIRGLKPDIIHETNYSLLPPGLDVHAKRVLTVYDMIHEKFMPNTHTPERKRASIARADIILCISECTRRDLLDFYPNVASKTFVTPLGASVPSGSLQRYSQLEEPYILFVGNRAGYKNYNGLLKAYAGCPDLYRRVKLVVWGGGEWTHQEIAQINKLGMQNHIVKLSDSVNLNSLYQHAETFVFPSLYEGFGLPLLEAMANGCPVACSNASCFPEVAGDEAVYFDPNCTTSIAQVILTSLTSQRRVFQAPKRYTWGNTVEQTVRLLYTLR